MKQCIICRSRLSDKAEVCEQCGFPVRRHFLSETHYRTWMRESAIPYREQWNERQESKTDQDEIASGSKKIPYGLILMGAIAVIIAVRVLVVAGTGGNSAAHGHGSWGSGSAGSAVVGSAMYEQTEPEFDLDLFCNLPLTSKEEIMSWLDENGYTYWEKTVAEPSEWVLGVTAKSGQTVRISYEGARTNYQSCYEIRYDYNNEGANDLRLQNWLSERMKQRSDGEYLSENENYYFNGAETYQISKQNAFRWNDTESTLDEISHQANEMMEFAATMPSPSEKQDTLDWLDQKGILYEHENEQDDDFYVVSLNEWRTVYFPESTGNPHWTFHYYVGNPQEYYRVLKSKLESEGYQAGEETENKYGGYDITYSYDDRQDITMSYEMLPHHIFFYIGFE